VYDLTKPDLGVLIRSHADTLATQAARPNQLTPNLPEMRKTLAALNQLLDLLEASGKKAK
jgi:hypothetical protein